MGRLMAQMTQAQTLRHIAATMRTQADALDGFAERLERATYRQADDATRVPNDGSAIILTAPGAPTVYYDPSTQPEPRCPTSICSACAPTQPCQQECALCKRIREGADE